MKVNVHAALMEIQEDLDSSVDRLNRLLITNETTAFEGENKVAILQRATGLLRAGQASIAEALS